jgi:regulator of replication initiation timing
MKEILRVLNEEIERLKEQISENKRHNKRLFDENSKLITETQRLKIDLFELSKYHEELKNKK